MRGSLFSVFLLSASAVWATPKYEIKEYINVAGVTVNQAYAAYNGELNFGGGSYPNTKSFYRKNGVVTDLTSKFNLRSFVGSGISSSGMAGTFFPNVVNPDLKGGYIQGETLHTIPSLEMSSWIIPTGINDPGIIVGYTYLNSGYDHTNSFIYNTVTGDRLDFSISTFTRAYGINNSGDVALSLAVEGGDDGLGSAYTSVLHTKSNSYTVLGPGSPRAINESGQIASLRSGGGFSWYQEGHESITKTWPQFNLAAITGFGNDGLIVGSNYAVSIFRGFVATPADGGMFLDDIVTNRPAGKFITDPILDRANGDIYASLSNANGGGKQLVRLQSVPEPMSLIAVAMGSLVLLRRCRN